MSQKLLLSVAVVLLAACSSKSTVVTYDFSSKVGLYVLGYASDENLRRAIEDQLVADIGARDMVAFASHADLPALAETNRTEVVRAANAKQALAVLVVSQVIPGEDGLVKNPARVSLDNPDVAEFYEYTKSVEENYTQGTEVFAEVNAFLLEGKDLRLVWSGTIWSFDADGKGGAISSISDNIAAELEQIRNALRPSDK